MKAFIGILVLLLIACTAEAQQVVTQYETRAAKQFERISAGISAGHYRYDPGIAIEFTTRPVFDQHVSLRIRAGVQWLEAYKAVHDQWIAYQSFSTGLVYNTTILERTRFFMEFGILGMVPDARFSDKSFVEGVYQFNGLETILMEKKDYSLCLYLGVGPAFTKASAEKIEGNPSYGNGLHFINGFRVYIGR